MSIQKYQDIPAVYRGLWKKACGVEGCGPVGCMKRGHESITSGMEVIAERARRFGERWINRLNYKECVMDERLLESAETFLLHIICREAVTEKQSMT